MTSTNDDEPNRIAVVLDEIKAALGAVVQDQMAARARLDRMESKLEDSLGAVTLRVAEVAARLSVLGIDHGTLACKLEQIRTFAQDVQLQLVPGPRKRARSAPRQAASAAQRKKG